MHESRKITIHSEWFDMCRRLSPDEGCSILQHIIDFALFDILRNEYEDRYVRYVWDKISEDMIADMEDDT